VTGVCNWNDISKATLYRWDSTNSGFAGMTPRKEYLLRAAELSAKAQAENDHARKVEFQNLARAFLRLAEQAERNSHSDIGYETPPKKDCHQAYEPAARALDADKE
jgi:hypothetical protein